MAQSNKKYYWLRLKDDFFSQRVIKKLRKIAGGDTYTIIYLKLQLLSLKNGGKLYFESVEDDFAKEMALALDEDTENVSITLSFLQKYGLVEELKENEFSLPETINSIGSETQVAERVRKHRENQKTLQCNTLVTNCNTEKEKEIDIEIEIDKELDIDKDKELLQEQEEKNSGNSDFNIFIYMQERGFVSISPVLMEKIQADVEIYSLEEVKKAIEIADENGVHKYSYVKAVIEKRRAGVNEKTNAEVLKKKAREEFLNDKE